MTELNERINDDNWCVDAHGNVSRNGTRICGPDGLDAYVPIVRRLLAAWWAAQPPCKDPIVGEWHGHLVSRCRHCGYPMQRGWPHRCKVQTERNCSVRKERHTEPKPFTWPDAERVMLAGGECERKSFTSNSWYRCRVRDDGKLRQFYSPEYGAWFNDLACDNWNRSTWRPCSAPGVHFLSRVDESDEWTLVRECTWLPCSEVTND